MKQKVCLTLFVLFSVWISTAKAQIIVLNDIACTGDASGELLVVPDFGTSPYTYAWSTGAVNTTITNLTAGLYSVTVTDALLATTIYSETLIDPPPIIINLVTQTNVLCAGASTGALDISVAGGVGSYFYDWSNGALSEDISNISAGTYTIIVTDQNGCNANATFIITEPALPLQVSITYSDVSCFGGNNGTATANPFGGTGAYSYSWSTGAITQSIVNLIAGNYSVTITDANGCTAVENIIISEPSSPVQATIVKTDVSCFGGNNGSASVTNTSGGTGPLNFLWSNGATTSSIINLIAGLYSVTITDANGCQFIGSVNITQPASALTVTLVTQTNVLCNGASTGAIDVNVVGGTLPYSYDWSNGAVSQDISNVPAGAYTLVVTDANGCVFIFNRTITQPATAVQVFVLTTNVSCFGGNNGTATANPFGGTGAYSYSWSTGAITQSIVNLIAGNYSVTVTDANGCTAVENIIISEPSSPVQATIVKTDVSCFGGNNGSASVTNTSGGTGPLNFLWSNGATTSSIINLIAGLYSVTITDANGCQFIGSVNITQPASALTVTLVTQTNVLCNGASTGAIDVNVVGGTLPYSYDWSNGAVSQDISNVPAGAYTLVVTDANGCVFIFNRTITQPATAVQVFVLTTNVSCFGGNNGTATANPFGGTGAYSYSWSTGAITQSIVNLIAGNYSVTVTDANGCTAVENIIISEPSSPVQGYVIGTNINCFGYGNGTVQAFYSGGTGSLNYSWSNGVTTPFLDSLLAGVYVLTVTDSLGCMATDSIIIFESNAIVLTVDSIHNVNCFGYSDGDIYLSSLGGSGNLSFSWLHNGSIFPEVTEDLIDIPAGTYTVMATDSFGCHATLTMTVTQPAQTFFVYTVNPVICNNGNEGSIQIQPLGIDTPYVVIFSTGDTISTDTVSAPTISGLYAGTYNCLIIGSSGCPNDTSIVLNQPLPIAVGLDNITPVICKADSTGAIILDNVHGGTQPYTFSWSNGLTGNPITNLVAGIYSVVITDALNCTIHETYVVDEPYNFIKFFATAKKTSCRQAEDGSIVLYDHDVYDSPYHNHLFLYDSLMTTLIDSAEMGEVIGNLPSGLYFGVLINEHGCSARDSIRVGLGDKDCLLIPNLVTSNGDGFNDVFQVSGGCEYDQFVVKIFTAEGSEVFTSDDCNFTWDAKTALHAASNTIFWYYIKVTENGKVYEFKSSLNINY